MRSGEKIQVCPAAMHHGSSWQWVCMYVFDMNERHRIEAERWVYAVLAQTSRRIVIVLFAKR